MSLLDRVKQAVGKAIAHGAGGQYERALQALPSQAWGGRVRLPPRAPMLKFAIDSLHAHRRPLPHPPWHSDGGPFTYFEAHIEDSDAAFIVGVSHGEGCDLALPFGRAALAVADRQAGAKLLAQLARALCQDAPGPRAAAGETSLETRSVVFATDLVRQSDGSYGGEGGGWTACKWMLERGAHRAELLVHYNLAERRGDFTEKDPSERTDLLALVAALRDGPPPERTPDNDITLAADGPRFGDFRLVLVRGASYHGHGPGGSPLLCSEPASTGGREVVAIDPEAPGSRQLLGRVDGHVARVACADAGATRTLVWSLLPEHPDRVSDQDPARLWLLEGGSVQEIRAPWGDRNVRPANAPLCPDAPLLAVTSWAQARGARRPHRLVHLHDASTQTHHAIEIPDTSLDVVGWRGRDAVVLGDEDEPFDERPAFFADATTGKLAPVRDRTLLLPYDPAVSPDLRFRVAIDPRKALVLVDLAEGSERVLALHPEDARYAVPGCVEWLGSRYLLFDAARLALIDTTKLQMSFPVSRDEPQGRLFVLPGLRFVVSERAEGVFLGRVTDA